MFGISDFYISSEAVEAFGAVLLFRLPKLPALQECVCEHRISSHCFLDARKESPKVVLQPMLKQARCDCAAKVLIGAVAPTQDE
jgi:hypothetical protein